MTTLIYSKGRLTTDTRRTFENILGMETRVEDQDKAKFADVSHANIRICGEHIKFIAGCGYEDITEVVVDTLPIIAKSGYYHALLALKGILAYADATRRYSQMMLVTANNAYLVSVEKDGDDYKLVVLRHGKKDRGALVAGSGASCTATYIGGKVTKEATHYRKFMPVWLVKWLASKADRYTGNIWKSVEV